MLSYSLFGAIFIALISFYYPELIQKPKETLENEISPDYDFIIVGAGSAGCVLTRRLSEVKSWRILLLEAGGDETAESKTPIFTPFQPSSARDWNYTTVKQKITCQLNDGICNYPRGHVMGGSSGINYMVYVRGNKLDFDEWEMDGAEGWNYENVLPYFLKSEHNQIDELNGSPYHNKGGLLSVQYLLYDGNTTQAILKGGEELGMKIRDYNGEHQNSFSRFQMTMNGPMRWSTSSAFLTGFNSPNLNIIKNAKVLKVLIDPNSKTAQGVVFRKNGITRIIKANKEVILSAGAINSPQLLMLSGVGPKDHLSSLNIPVIADLPVGNNLQDHYNVPIPMQLSNFININPNYHLTVENSLEFAMNKSGVFSNNGCPATAFLNTGPDINAEPPDMQFHFIETYPYSKNIFTFTAAVTKPQSSGTVRLRSSNPDDEPLIDVNFLSEQIDIDRTLAGLNILLKLMNTDALKPFSPKISEQDTERCVANRSNNTAFLFCLTKIYGRTNYHPTSTCKMGSANSTTSVVDPELKVIGVKNLRVIDASVMPNITRGNTNAPTIMIAEKGSDIIKLNYGINT